MPAAKFRCWRQNLKVVAQITQTPLKDVEQSRCTCAHPERGEAEKKGEITSSLRHRRHKSAACLGGLTSLIFTMTRELSRRCIFDEFESLATPLWVASRVLMGFILLAFRWVLPASTRTRK